MFEGINWLAVIVAGVLYFGIGALWYSPVLFAKPFIRYREITQGKMEQGGQPIEYLFTLVLDLAAALVLALFVRMAGAITLLDGIGVGLLTAVGFALTTALTFTIYSGPHKMLWAIYSGYVLVAFALMGAILAAWR